MEIHISRDGRQTGPFTDEQVRSMLNGELLSVGDLAWHGELEDWQPLWKILGCPPPVPLNALQATTVLATAAPGEYLVARNQPTPRFIREEIWKVILLVVVTFGLYGVYLLPHQNDHFAELSRRKRMPFWGVFGLTIVTLGIFGIFYQIWQAACLQKFSEELNTPGRNPSLSWHVTRLNIVSFVLMFSTAGMAIPASLFLGAYAFWLVQQELNLYVDKSIGD